MFFAGRAQKFTITMDDDDESDAGRARREMSRALTVPRITAEKSEAESPDGTPLSEEIIGVTAATGGGGGLSDFPLLHNATDQGNLEQVEALCAGGAEVDRLCDAGATPLVVAACRGYTAVIGALLSRGADVGLRCTKIDRTALHAAALFGHADLVPVLCSAGAAVGCFDAEGLSALHQSVCCGNEAVAAALLECGADMNGPGGWKSRTPLQLGACYGRASIVRLLCAAGAEVDREDADGMTALHLAVRCSSAEANKDVCGPVDRLGERAPLQEAARMGCARLVGLLCEAGAGVERADGDGKTAPHTAVRQDRADAAEALISGGADIDRSRPDGRTALQLAAIVGNVEIARLLCALGAEVERTDAEGMTVLHKSIAWRDSVAVVTALLECGAEVDHCHGPLNRTALHLAAALGQVAQAVELCRGGAEVNLGDSDGMTALHHAVQLKDNVAMVTALLDRGANPNCCCVSRCCTPLHVAAECGHHQLVVLLCAYGAVVDVGDAAVNTALHLAVINNQVEVAKALVECGANMNAVGSDGRTPLHEAALDGRVDLVRLLCAAGADVAMFDAEGMTALHLAIESDKSEVTRVLLEHGVNVNVRDSLTGRTPLCMAAAYGRADGIRMLCAADADTAITAHNGLNPVVAAMGGGHVEAIAALCECGADPNVSGIANGAVTPLMMSAILGSDSLARTLLEGGACADLQAFQGVTASHVAAEKNHHSVVEELLRAGANTEARSTNPRWPTTPLHVACRNTGLECVLALLRGGADERSCAEILSWRDYDAGGDDGGGGSGGSVAAAASTLTAIDVIGFGRFGLGEDPQQRGHDESDEEFASRRDPATMERIREALLRAARDRLWARRGWLMVIRAQLEQGGGGGGGGGADVERGAGRALTRTAAKGNDFTGETTEVGDGDCLREGEGSVGSAGKRYMRGPAQVATITAASAAPAALAAGEGREAEVGARAGGTCKFACVGGDGELEPLAGVARARGDGCTWGGVVMAACDTRGLVGLLFDLSAFEEGMFRRVVCFL